MDYIEQKEIFLDFRVTPITGSIQAILDGNKQTELLNQLINRLLQAVNARENNIEIFYVKDYDPFIHSQGSHHWPLFVKDNYLIIRAKITTPAVATDVFKHGFKAIIEEENFKVLD